MRFKNGRESLEDEERRVRQLTLKNYESVEKIPNLVRLDRRYVFIMIWQIQ